MKIVQVTLIFYMQKFDLKILDDFIILKTFKLKVLFQNDRKTQFYLPFIQK